MISEWTPGAVRSQRGAMTPGLICPAIILAAGEGRRLGEAKVLLELGGQPLLGWVTAGCRAGGFAPLVAVVPTAHREEIRSQFSDLDVLDNPAPETGPLGSLHLALEPLPTSAAGLLLQMVDFPGVNPATYRALGRAIRSDPSRLWRPVHEGRDGHPVWFPASLFPALREAPPDKGARAVVHAHEGLWSAVAVDDPWIHRDLNVPEDLAPFRAHLGAG